MRFPVLRFQTQHKFVRQLKKFLNELVQPSPNLPLDDIFDEKTYRAVRLFKVQWANRVYHVNTIFDGDVTAGTWAMIGRALSRGRIQEELRQARNDHELRSLLLGMDIVGAQSTLYTSSMESCDAKIASILGGKNAIASANGFEPDSLAVIRMLGGRYSYNRIEHLSTYIMHLYGSTDGTRFGVDGKTSTEIFIPDGFEKLSNINREGGKKDVLTQKPTPAQAVVTFFYKRLGNVTNTTLLLMHVKDFKPTKQGNRWYIGKIGGRGGEITNLEKPYLHSHFALLKGDVGLAYIKDDVTTNQYRESIKMAFREAFC